jgi:hypothetical protein
MRAAQPSSRWAVANPVVGGGLVILYTFLSLTSVARTGLVGLAAIGPFLWLMRAGRELVRLLEGRSTPRRVLIYVTLLVALTIVEFATVYNWMRGSFGGMTSRVAPLYFSVSTFTTTGYGDIHPLTSAAQLTTIAQMLLDWIETTVVVGVVLATLVEVLGRRRPGRA